MSNRSVKKTTAEFLKEIETNHPESYAYYNWSETVYTGARGKTTIICPVHGTIDVRCHSLLQGAGCKSCSLINAKDNRKKLGYGKTVSLREFKERGNIKYNNWYDYSKVHFNTTADIITIICPDHGEFSQLASGHLYGYGCNACGNDVNRITMNEFINRYKDKYPNILYYNWEQSVYKSNNTKIVGICPAHGPFDTTPNNMVSTYSCGCTECESETIKYNNILIFKHNVHYIFGDRINTQFAQYVKAADNITIICDKHGFTEITGHRLVHGTGVGCVECCSEVSASQCELSMRDLIRSCGVIDIINNNRTILSKNMELDIVAPDHKTAIEVNGAYFHSSKFDRNHSMYHFDKTTNTNKAGYELFHINEFDIIKKFSVVESILKKYFGDHSNIIKVDDYIVGYVNQEDAIKFHLDNNLDYYDSCDSDFSVGLMFSDVICCLITANKKDETLIIKQISHHSKYWVDNGFKILLNAIINQFKFKHVKAIVNRDYPHYKRICGDMGLIQSDVLDPTFVYYKGYNVVRDVIDIKDLLDWDDGLDEFTNAANNHFHRYYNSGWIVYELSINRKPKPD